MKNMTPAERKRIARELTALQQSTRVDWIRNAEEKPLAEVLAVAVAHKNFRLLAAAYAAAIITHGMDGQIDWEDLHKRINVRWRMTLNPVDAVKTAAWGTIRKAKRRQQKGRPLPPARKVRVPVMAHQQHPQAERFKTAASYAVAIALVLLGAFCLLRATDWAARILGAAFAR